MPVKRFELLIDAAVRLKPSHPDLRLVIAGEGYERPALEEQIRRAGAEEWISLAGFVDDKELIELYQSSWLVASSSFREGWGMTVTEAGACGTPAVASRISGHMDAVRDGESGLLFDDVDGMVKALDMVLSDPPAPEPPRGRGARLHVDVQLGVHGPSDAGRAGRRGDATTLGPGAVADVSRLRTALTRRLHSAIDGGGPLASVTETWDPSVTGCSAGHVNDGGPGAGQIVEDATSDSPGQYGVQIRVGHDLHIEGGRRG